jgi:hypothetical protein
MKVPKWIVPILVVALTAAGLGIAQLFAIPTIEVVIDSEYMPQNVAMVTLIIPGVRCADTARSAASSVEDIAGVIKFVAFASHNRVEITYDQHLTDPESLIEAIEGPVYNAESGEFLFGVFVVSETIKN